MKGKCTVVIISKPLNAKIRKSHLSINLIFVTARDVHLFLDPE